MARKKRTSAVLETAHKRSSGLKSIDPAPNFGATLTLPAYSTEIGDFSSLLDTYNQMLSALDEFQNRVDAGEEHLNETNKRMLSAAEAHYGPDSSEYEQAGGTRLSERKRPKKKTPSPPAS